MKTEVITAIIAFLGTASGTLSGIVINSRLTNFRIEQLEKKVDKHNNVIERTYENEREIAILKQENVETDRRLENLEKGVSK